MKDRCVTQLIKYKHTKESTLQKWKISDLNVNVMLENV
jgi:hypothetical protein